MGDWKSQIRKVKKEIRDASRVQLSLPAYFSFKDHDAFDFDKALHFFDWSLRDRSVLIDISKCRSANYQSLSLLILYAWRLKSNGCRVDFLIDEEIGAGGASDVWRMMGGPGLFSVGFNENQNFRSNNHKPLIAIRNHTDFKVAMEQAGAFSKEFNIEYINTLRYVISELLYNTLEHGIAFFEDLDSWNKRLPSLIQFTWYVKRDEIQFIVADVGMGVKRHLSQTYPGLEDDEAALRKAIQPQVSGTFGKSDPYTNKNNAGMGLFLSTNIVRRLRADMHIVSGNGVLHISPADVTTRRIENAWPGTFALVSIGLEKEAGFDLHSWMTEFRQAASRELDMKSKAEEEGTFYLSVTNYFGPYPEDKSAAIKYRDRTLLPAIDEGKKVLLDFDGVISSPHSFLNALLATPIKRLGMNAYRKIKVVNAHAEIRETIDFILEDNTSEGSLDL
jgi:hypothetical protein